MIEDLKSGKWKVPGEIRGHFSKYLSLECKEAFTNIDANKNLEIMLSLNNGEFLHIYKEPRWNSIQLRISVRLPQYFKQINY